MSLFITNNVYKAMFYFDVKSGLGLCGTSTHTCLILKGIKVYIITNPNNLYFLLYSK